MKLDKHQIKQIEYAYNHTDQPLEAFKALGWGYDMQKAGVKIKGAGMNMLFALNYHNVVKLQQMGLIKSAKVTKLMQAIR